MASKVDKADTTTAGLIDQALAKGKDAPPPPPVQKQSELLAAHVALRLKQTANQCRA
jgi:hypothetical protein